jgi:hypothetical protein
MAWKLEVVMKGLVRRRGTEARKRDGVGLIEEKGGEKGTQ